MGIPNVPSVTLSEILHLALPTGSRVLAGEARLGSRVHWARLLRARPTGLGSVEPGELLMLSAGLLDSLTDSRVQARLVAELIEAGVTAFALAGEPPDGILTACKSSDTPLLQLPADAVLAEVERAIVGLILDRDAQLRRRAEEVYGRLLEGMLGNAGLPALVDALAEATGLRAAVFDDYLALKACAPDDEYFQRELVATASAAVLRESSAAVAPFGRPLPLRFDHAATSWRGQLYPLQIGAAWAGFLALVGRPGETGELDRLLADRAAMLVALELAKQRAVAEATQRGRTEFLDDLLEGSFPSEEAILARARQLGYDLLSPHLTFVLSADPAAPTGAPAGPPSAARQRRRFADIARATLMRLEPRALAVERDGAIVALRPTEATNDAAATALVEAVRAETSEALPEIGVSAGLARPVAHPREFPAAQRMALQALAVGQSLLGGGRTVHYGQLGIERLLLHLLGNPELEQFALDVLGGLLSYDAQHRGELVRTLEVFLSCNGNHVRAAQELHLHRNTLLYRLDRAREILGRDLEDAETRLALQVALRLRGTIATSRPEIRQAPAQIAGRRRRAG
jgi:purine catabolism regulator